ncbi:Altered inheritance of mitochondria protein 24, mitochondrial [Labeo rohita]|uniref:Altered inheritance of mitochondria protein 24, mitochondrial n=1 Tax=Labeo rohita TaxID=84645 RepID=A0ABQ8MEQ2_LABRO|nr:Altered inheritance of mitochondria protein 24, mitochondrial [Labeo rohita]
MSWPSVQLLPPPGPFPPPPHQCSSLYSLSGSSGSLDSAMRFSLPTALPSSVKAADAPVLHAEIAILLVNDAIELVPPADMRTGFYIPYFIVTKKGGELRPILDLCTLNWPFTDYHSRCSRRSTSSDFFCGPRSRDEHISTKSCPVAPCLHESHGPTETISESLGAYGNCSGSHTAGAAPYEIASTLAPRPSPEEGVAARHSPGQSYTGLPPNLHPVAGSVEGLDGPSARVASSTPCLEPSQRALMRQGTPEAPVSYVPRVLTTPFRDQVVSLQTQP